MKKQCNKANKLIFARKRVVNRNWGLSPDKLRWIYIYKQVIIPNLTYSCFAWAHRTTTEANDRNSSITKLLQRIQRRASLHITGGMYNTPTATLEIMASLRPSHLEIQIKAYEMALRLKLNKNG